LEKSLEPGACFDAPPQRTCRSTASLFSREIIMSDLDFDPELFGTWPKAPAYDGLRLRDHAADEALEAVADRLILDTKAEARGTSLDELQDMLNTMTKELREQMQQFQRLRRIADETATEGGEELDRKAVQADAKASIEAMSVIVRTLEKIDALQRTIAHDRQLLTDSDFDEAGYKAYAARIEAKIEIRARQIADRREREKSDDAKKLEYDGANAGLPGAAQVRPTGPPDASAG
jgi:hypothetical protein